MLGGKKKQKTLRCSFFTCAVCRESFHSALSYDRHIKDDFKPQHIYTAHTDDLGKLFYSFGNVDGYYVYHNSLKDVHDEVAYFQGESNERRDEIFKAFYLFHIAKMLIYTNNVPNFVTQENPNEKSKEKLCEISEENTEEKSKRKPICQVKPTNTVTPLQSITNLLQTKKKNTLYRARKFLIRTGSLDTRQLVDKSLKAYFNREPRPDEGPIPYDLSDGDPRASNLIIEAMERSLKLIQMGELESDDYVKSIKRILIEYRKQYPGYGWRLDEFLEGKSVTRREQPNRELCPSARPPQIILQRYDRLLPPREPSTSSRANLERDVEENSTRSTTNETTRNATTRRRPSSPMQGTSSWVTRPQRAEVRPKRRRIAPSSSETIPNRGNNVENYDVVVVDSDDSLPDLSPVLDRIRNRHMRRLKLNGTRRVLRPRGGGDDQPRYRFSTESEEDENENEDEDEDEDY